MRKSKSTNDDAFTRADVRKIEELEKFFHSHDWQAHEDRTKEAFRPDLEPAAQVVCQ